MYQKHPNLIEPIDATVLWRYMDFQKFFYLLEYSMLYFARIPTLNDPFEGAPSRLIIEATQNLPDDLSEEETERRAAISKHNIEVYKNSRKLSCVNCWHMNDTESAAMWELYLKSNEGIAIKTTFEKYKSSLKETEIAVQGGIVNYVDYDTYDLLDLNIIGWSALKRKSFEHEKEFRGIVLDTNISKAGVSVPVDVNILLDEIYISPTATDWSFRLLQSMINRYEIDISVTKSKLYEDPSYL